MTKKPNFFIVGMPRAGSTSMYEYLKPHPDIFMSPVKEPNYFGKDLIRSKNTMLFNGDEKKYLKLFENVSNQKIIGEASVSYIFSESAVNEIFNFNPDSKILILLRHPTELIFSIYNKNTQTGILGSETFEGALENEKNAIANNFIPDTKDWKKNGSWIFQGCLYRKNIYYLPESIKNFQNKFGENNVKIVIFDDIKENIEELYRDILTFLEIDESFVPEFKIHNAQEVAKIKFIKNALDRNGVWLGKLRRIFSKEQIPFIVWLKSLNVSKKVKMAEINPKTRAKLVKEFIPVVEELEEITGRDLSAWKK